MHRCRWVAVVGALSLAVACGGDDGGGAAADADIGPDADPCAVTPPTGLLTSIDELDTSMCDLAAFDLDQVVGELWTMDGQVLGGPIRLTENECGQVATSNVVFGKSVYVEAVDGGLFVRGEFGAEPYLYTEAAFLCAAASGDYTWSGALRTCGPDFNGGTTCGDGATGLRPFGWNEGDVEAEGLELVGEYRGGGTSFESRIVGVRVRGDIAYLGERDGVRIVDVSDPSAPVELGYHRVGDVYVNDIDVIDRFPNRYALLATGNDGVMVVDVSDANDTELVSVLEFAPGATAGVHRMFVEEREAGGARLYMSDGHSGAISIWDVTDPAQATQLGLYMDPFEQAGYHDLHVAGDRMYINDMFGDRFLVVDAADPFRPVELGSVGPDPRIDFSHSAWVTEVGGRRVAAVGNEGYDTTVAVVDVDPSSPEFMAVLGSWKLRPEVSAHHMVARGDRVYVSHYLDGLRVLDISDPANPTQVAFFNTWDRQVTLGGGFYGAYDVELTDDYIFVADTSRGLLILRED